MCFMSMVGNDWSDKWKQTPVQPLPYSPTIVPNQPYTPPSQPYTPEVPFDFGSLYKKQPPTREELEVLRAEVLELKKILEKAKTYDIENDEPHCHMDEKIAIIRSFANAFNIDVTSIFDSKDDVAKSDVYEPFKVINDNNLAGSFDSKELAQKFADYLTKYTGNPSHVVTIHEHLRWAITRNDQLIATFGEESDALMFHELHFQSKGDGEYHLIDLEFELN